MDDVTSLAERTNGSAQSPVLIIIEPLVLTRTCILSILTREFTGFEVVEMATTDDLHSVSGRDVRLVALDIGDRPIVDPSVEDDLTRLAQWCPSAIVALLSNRDDEATAVAAMQRGIRGFFPTSIPVEIAIAGLRLVLAGGIYRPLQTINENGAPSLAFPCSPPLTAIHEATGIRRDVAEKTLAHFTPREQHVLAELQLGLPNKLIAAKLNLSENTVKMHIQHIMRKFSAHNRTEAVLRWRTLLEA
jgi:DNA-binding NarL/FixJ family response regulator